ncbi:MAG: threonine synthase [Candidatus Bathyarchaeota archaeon]|nr:threonine synthase [Candidatus Bathyarchaeota archaeon]
MSFFQKCLECGFSYEIHKIVYRCPRCDSPVEIVLNIDVLKEKVSKNLFANKRTYTMWRYIELLPVSSENVYSLGEGFTPTIKSRNLSESLKIGKLNFKLDFLNPTGSFKDRGASVLISKAKEFKTKAVVIDSSGNAAASLASYAARANLQCYVFIPAYVSTGKVVQAIMSNAFVVKIDGTRSEAYEAALIAHKEYGWYYCGFQLNPYLYEGNKTIGYEIYEQFNWNAPPDWVVFPVGTGSVLLGCWKGLKEFYNLGLADKIPSLVCIQPEGCAPIAKAYLKGLDTVMPVNPHKTIAEGLMIPSPFRGKYVLTAIKESNGLAEVVSDDEIVEAMKLLAKYEGIFVEPSAAASFAGVRKLVDSGEIGRDDDILCILTGSGLKTQEICKSFVKEPVTIKASITSLKKIFGEK